MRVLLNVNGMSQYGEMIRPEFRNSACGPTTAHVILNYLCAHNEVAKKDINELYEILGSTKIGLFKWRLIKNLRAQLGENFLIEECDISVAITQLKHGNPVAMKFDQYFTFQWLTKRKPLYKYHWVPLIGYEIKDEELYLIIHDNGGKNRESQVHSIKYDDNRHVLSFVKIEPKE